MPTPIASSSNRPASLHQAPPPEGGAAIPTNATRAQGAATPSRAGAAAPRDDFGAPPSHTQGAQGAQRAGSAAQPSARASIEGARRLVEGVPLPPPRAPQTRAPGQSLAQTIDRQRGEARDHAVLDAALFALEQLPQGRIVANVRTAGTVAAHTLHDISHGRNPVVAALDHGAQAALEHGAHGLLQHFPAIAGVRATIGAAAHILHDGAERRAVAQQASTHDAELARIAQADRFSRMDGQIAANAVGNPSAPPTSRIDVQRLQTDRAYAVAVRETLAQRAQALAP